jgi:hypothetical protein
MQYPKIAIFALLGALGILEAQIDIEATSLAKAAPSDERRGTTSNSTLKNLRLGTARRDHCVALLRVAHAVAANNSS